MAKRIFVPAGRTFRYDGVVLRAEPTPYNNAVCTGCWFSDWEREKRGQAKTSCYIHGYCCTAHNRRDGRHVIFRKVK